MFGSLIGNVELLLGNLWEFTQQSFHHGIPMPRLRRHVLPPNIGRQSTEKYNDIEEKQEKTTVMFKMCQPNISYHVNLSTHLVFVWYIQPFFHTKTTAPLARTAAPGSAPGSRPEALFRSCKTPVRHRWTDWNKYGVSWLCMYVSVLYIILYYNVQYTYNI